MLELINKCRPFWLTYLFVFLLACMSLLVWGGNALTFSINACHGTFMDRLAQVFTWFGDGNITLFLTLILLFFSFGRASAFLIISNLAGFFAQLLKRNFFASSVRPAVYFKGQHLALHFVDGVQIFHAQSFPSGHTTTAFSVALLLSYYGRKTPWQILLVLAACLVGWSRIYLAEHFFIDVLAGSVLGSMSTLFLLYALDKTGLNQKRWFNSSFLHLYRQSKDRVKFPTAP